MRRRLCAAAPLRIIRRTHNQVTHLIDRVADNQQIDVGSGDLARRENRFAHPVQQPIPVRAVEQNDRKVAHLPGLHQRQRLEQLIERTESAGEDHERLSILDQHHLAHEKIAERHRCIDIRIEMLFKGEFDIETDRPRSRFARATVARFHNAGSAAGNNRKTRLTKRPRHIHGRLIHRIVNADARRSENRDRRTNISQHLEAIDKLPHNPQHPPGVGAEEIGVSTGTRQ
jgi:hypothetical protein